MLEFYPNIKKKKKEKLKVSDIHTLNVEQVGNPKGFPVIFLHGGPGGGISPDHRRYFDPKFYRIILFDQRGCGESTPYAELKENTTCYLVNKNEKEDSTRAFSRFCRHPVFPTCEKRLR